MAIEPISGLGGVSVPTQLPGSYVLVPDTSPAHVALTLELAKESETLEQRANDGDPIALSLLAQDAKLLVPIDSQQLLPPPLEHSGAYEAGKGILVDIYN